MVKNKLLAYAAYLIYNFLGVLIQLLVQIDRKQQMLYKKQILAK